MNIYLWTFISVLIFAVTFIAFFIVGISFPIKRYKKSLKCQWSEDAGEVIADLKYGELERNKYDLYIPKKLRDDKEPSLILFIHGGGFTGGKKEDIRDWCEYYASRGYIAASAGYTLMSEETKSNINLMNDEIHACVKAIKDECLARGYDIKQMATSGQSAGGCLAMLYAYSHENDSPIPVKFVFQQTGPAGFHLEYWGGNDDDSVGVVAAVKAWSGKDVTPGMVKDQTYRRVLDAISPAYCVSENTVPTLCAYGPYDKVVPPNIKFALFEAFEKHGVKYDYIEFENSGHGMLGNPEKQKLFLEKSHEYCDKFFR